MDPGSPSPMENHSTGTMGTSSSSAMNAHSPASIMDYESISSRDIEVYTPASDDTETIEPATTSGPWRVAHTLKNHNNVKLETPTAPALIFWQGHLWLSYRTTGNRILLGVRKDNEPGNNQYQEYDLSADSRTRAKSDHPPAIAGFNDRLYVAWKSEGPNTGIWYQSTDGQGNWRPQPILIGASYRTSSAPVLQEYHGRLYLAWLAEHPNGDRTFDIWFSHTADGSHWSPPVRQQVNEAHNFARSPYFPDFSILNDTLYLFWGSGPTRGDQVYYAPVNLASVVHLTAIHGGSWRTNIGNALAYRVGQEWIFTTGLDNGIWEATGPGWERYANLKNSPATAISSHSPSAAIVPGFTGKLAKPSRIFLVWKNQGNNNTLWESSYDI